MTQGLCLYLGLVAVSLASSPAAALESASSPVVGEPSAVPSAPQPVTALHPKRANFLAATASDSVRQAADWVVDSEDNRSLPFLIVDKKDARVYAFDARGQYLGQAPALLGLAHGDDTVPGIGTKPLSKIRPEERTTPAGRFVASLGRDLGKLDVLWIDYDDAISLHRVIKGTAKEHRAQRLATATPLDNRISFGCINVPAVFFDRIVDPTFTGTNGIVYILPDIKTMREVFPAYYDVKE